MMIIYVVVSEDGRIWGVFSNKNLAIKCLLELESITYGEIEEHTLDQR